MGKPLNNRNDYERVAMKAEIPATLALPLIEYIFTGTYPGGFLSGIVRNDLKSAVMYANDESLIHLKKIVLFLYNNVPGMCWGDTLAKDFVERGGLEGIA